MQSMNGLMGMLSTSGTEVPLRKDQVIVYLY